MKANVALVSLASLLLLCAVSISTHAAPSTPPTTTPTTSVTLTTGIFTTTLNTYVSVVVVNIGGPSAGPVTVEESIISDFNTVIVSNVWTIQPGMAAATSASFNYAGEVRAVVKIPDQRQRALVKPTAELLNTLQPSNLPYVPIIYIPSTEFTPVP
jgi:hypothetical protein